MAKVRLSLVLSGDTAKFMDDFCAEYGITRSEMLRRGFAIIKAFKQQKAIGRNHFGFVSDASKLDAEIIWD